MTNEHNLRRTFKTDEEGRYYWYCLRPVLYPVLDDGMSFILMCCFKTIAKSIGPVSKLRHLQLVHARTAIW